MIKRNIKGQFVGGVRTHGLTHSWFERCYRRILRRCNNPKDDAKYRGSRYCAKGIKVEWNTFPSFIDDMYESYLRHIEEFGQEQTTIDRIDNNGNYCKSNCRWATRKEQNINRTTTKFFTYGGETKCMKEWAKEYNFNYRTIRDRLLRYNWSIEKALTTPSQRIK